MLELPFTLNPVGNTVLVAVSSSTSVAATQISTRNEGGAWVANPSTVSVWLAAGSSSVGASIPTTAVPSQGLCLPAGQVRPVSISPSSAGNWLSAVTSAGATASIFVTPGVGR